MLRDRFGHGRCRGPRMRMLERVRERECVAENIQVQVKMKMAPSSSCVDDKDPNLVLPKFSQSSNLVPIIGVTHQQCDQIWQNFALL